MSCLLCTSTQFTGTLPSAPLIHSTSQANTQRKAEIEINHSNYSRPQPFGVSFSNAPVSMQFITHYSLSNSLFAFKPMPAFPVPKSVHYNHIRLLWPSSLCILQSPPFQAVIFEKGKSKHKAQYKPQSHSAHHLGSTPKPHCSHCSRYT
jgi:hypothetical protein